MTDQHTDLTAEDLETGAQGAPEVVSEQTDRDWEAEAREMGWKPKDEWTGDPEQWRDAQEFVKRGEEFLPYVRAERDRLRKEVERKNKDFEDRIKRLDAANREALKRQKAQYEERLAELDRREEQAVSEGDTEAWKAIRQQREKLGAPPEAEDESSEAPAGVDPAVQEWASRPENDWFHTDDAMRAMAITVAGRVAQNGGDVNAQLRAAEAEVRKRFPEHFGTQKPRQAVETGGQPPRAGKRESRGVANLPREAREAFDEFVRMGVYSEKDLPEYAKAYWEQDK